MIKRKGIVVAFVFCTILTNAPLSLPFGIAEKIILLTQDVDAFFSTLLHLVVLTQFQRWLRRYI